jgi:hypothetical protein
MFNETHCIVKIKQSKMDFVKVFKPEAFGLFEYAVDCFKNFYANGLPTHTQIKRLSIYNNGVFKLESPNFIAIELNSENFNAFFDKHI